MPLYLFYTMVQKNQNDQKLKSKGVLPPSSELNTFRENVVIFFCSNHHLSYADNGQQNIMCDIWIKYCTGVGSKMGTQTKKIAEKTSLFFLLWLKAR